MHYLVEWQRRVENQNLPAHRLLIRPKKVAD